MATPRERIVFVKEEIEYPESDSESDEGHEDETDENSRSIRNLDKCLKQYDYFSNRGQTQLESFGFVSSRLASQLLKDYQQERKAKYLWETTRVNRLFSSDPIPVLLHVCRESRDLLQSYGYALAFSTRTSGPLTWFNFSEDILYLRSDSEETSAMVDGGDWNIGQFQRHDLNRVRRLMVNAWYFDHKQPVPLCLHWAVQIFGNLQELLLIEDDHNFGRDGITSSYWFEGNEDGEPVAVNASLTEVWGHHSGWKWGDRIGERGFIRSFCRDHWPRTVDPLGNASEDIQGQLKAQRALVKGEDGTSQSWTIPKVQFGIVMRRGAIKGFIEGRMLFKRYVNKRYWEKVAERRKGYRAPSPFSLVHSQELEVYNDTINDWNHDYWEESGIAWYTQAREALQYGNDPASPYTLEWIEASEAMLDMDSWPWAE